MLGPPETNRSVRPIRAAKTPPTKARAWRLAGCRYRPHDVARAPDYSAARGFGLGEHRIDARRRGLFQLAGDGKIKLAQHAATAGRSIASRMTPWEMTAPLTRGRCCRARRPRVASARSRPSCWRAPTTARRRRPIAAVSSLARSTSPSASATPSARHRATAPSRHRCPRLPLAGRLPPPRRCAPWSKAGI